MEVAGRTPRYAVLVLLAAAALGACTGTSEPAAGPATRPTSLAPSPTVRTLAPLPATGAGPPAGRLVADLRQSSRDAAAGRFQVWVGNGLAAAVRPSRVLYRDPRYAAPLRGGRLRAVPSGAERGFPLALPSRPRCAATGPTGQTSQTGQTGSRGRLEVRYRGPDGPRTARVAVEDEADVVARHVASRCFALDLRRAARLSVDDRVVPDGRADGVGVLTLRVVPSGRPGHRVRVRTVSGTPVLTPYRAPVWRPGVTVASDGAARVVRLRVAPARCDAHAFAESGGATAFRVRLLLDGEPGEVVVRMSGRGAAAALGFAREVCDRR